MSFAACWEVGMSFAACWEVGMSYDTCGRWVWDLVIQFRCSKALTQCDNHSGTSSLLQTMDPRLSGS